MVHWGEEGLVGLVFLVAFKLLDLLTSEQLLAFILIDLETAWSTYLKALLLDTLTPLVTTGHLSRKIVHFMKSI